MLRKQHRRKRGDMRHAGPYVRRAMRRHRERVLEKGAQGGPTPLCPLFPFPFPHTRKGSKPTPNTCFAAGVERGPGTPLAFAALVLVPDAVSSQPPNPCTQSSIRTPAFPFPQGSGVLSMTHIQQCDELAPLHHSITSSARASSEGGISRPSAFAVLRLITSSYLVGACTGRSAGFSPLRMRST